MDQITPLVTDIYDAMGDIVRALGGPKEVGVKLKPARPADEAAKWVKDCLNRERREKFDPDQIMWLLRQAREVNCHAAINYICAESGYSTPEPVELETELARLLRAYIECGNNLQKLQPRIEQAQAKLKSVG